MLFVVGEKWMDHIAFVKIFIDDKIQAILFEVASLAVERT
jgi:hypothetical protein